MKFKSVCAAVLALAALVPGAASAQADTGRWTVDYDVDNDLCWMEQTFDADDGATSSLGVDLPWDTTPLLIMRNSSWTMEQASTSAEVWFDGDWQRAADTIVSATVHKVDGLTHVDVAWSDDLLNRMASSEAMVIRVGNGPFERYTIGATGGAVASLFECYDTLY